MEEEEDLDMPDVDDLEGEAEGEVGYEIKVNFVRHTISVELECKK